MNADDRPHPGHTEMPLPEGPIDLTSLRAEIKTAWRDMDFAVAAAGLSSRDPIRLIMRVFRSTTEATASVVLELAQQIRITSAELAETRAGDRRLSRSAVEASGRALRSCAAVCVMMVVAVTLVALLVLCAQPSRSSSPFEVVFDAAGNGIIRCGPGARDGAGDFHCLMEIVLRSRQRR